MVAFSVFSSSRRLARPASLALVLALGGCTGSAPFDLASLTGGDKPKQADVATGSLPKSDLQKATEYWGKKVAENPKDATAAVNYVRNLKALGAKDQAFQVIQQAYGANPTNKIVASEYGRLAIEHDQLAVAEKLLEFADDPVSPDWRTINARGTVLAKQTKFRDAITQFERARTLAPNQPSILNNLALAYAMDGRPGKAEELLRQAVADKNADPKVAENLSLVLGLEGKVAEAKSVPVRDLAAEEVASDADLVHAMVGNAWQPNQTPGAAPNQTASQTAAIKTSAIGSARATASAKSQARAAAVATEDPAVTVKRLADGYSAGPSEGPIQIAPVK